MVRRTEVLPPLVVGHEAGVIVIWASVSPGSSEAAAFLATLRASDGLLRRAIARTPSRAAADRVPCTWKACPNSAIPRTRTMSSGTMKANSTALAPRSFRRRFHIRAHLPSRAAAQPHEDSESGGDA